MVNQNGQAPKFWEKGKRQNKTNQNIKEKRKALGSPTLAEQKAISKKNKTNMKQMHLKWERRT